MVGELGERVVLGLGVAWGDVEAWPGAPDQEGGCQGNALGRPGSGPVALGGGRVGGVPRQQPQIPPERLLTEGV